MQFLQRAVEEIFGDTWGSSRPFDELAEALLERYLRLESKGVPRPTDVRRVVANIEFASTERHVRLDRLSDQARQQSGYFENCDCLPCADVDGQKVRP